MSTCDKVITQGVLVRTDTLFLLDNGLALFNLLAPLLMWSVIRAQVVTSFEYCEGAGILPAHTVEQF